MSISYGKEVREKEFCLQPGSVFLNHGSYGVVPRKVKELHHRRIDQMDSHPDDWFRRENVKLWKEARDAAAQFVNCDPEDLVFVQNATTGVNTVLRSLKLDEGDIVVATNNTYGAVKNACLSTSSFYKDAHTHFLTIKFPITSEDDIVKLYENFFKTHSNVKIAVIDHITSPTAMVLPVKKLTQLCKQYGILSMIDGAHAPGQLPLNLPELGADFYTGNFHKWVYTPRGCAILWIKPEHHNWVAPLVTSHNYQKGNFLSFFMQGTRDDTAYTCVPEALKFYQDMGGYEEIKKYISGLLEEAVDRMVTKWGTEKLQIPKSMEAPFMRMVKLPDIPGYEKTLGEAQRMKDDINFRYDLVLYVWLINGEFYLRLSAEIYNTFEEFCRVADVILQMTKSDNTCPVPDEYSWLVDRDRDVKKARRICLMT